MENSEDMRLVGDCANFISARDSNVKWLDEDGFLVLALELCVITSRGFQIRRLVGCIRYNNRGVSLVHIYFNATSLKIFKEEWAPS
jgi:hypothetical protein